MNEPEVKQNAWDASLGRRLRLEDRRERQQGIDVLLDFLRVYCRDRCLVLQPGRVDDAKRGEEVWFRLDGLLPFYLSDTELPNIKDVLAERAWKMSVQLRVDEYARLNATLLVDAVTQLNVARLLRIEMLVRDLFQLRPVERASRHWREDELCALAGITP